MIAAIAAAAVLLRSVVFFIVVLPFLLILSLFSFVSSVLFYFPSFYFFHHIRCRVFAVFFTFVSISFLRVFCCLLSFILTSVRRYRIRKVINYFEKEL